MNLGDYFNTAFRSIFRNKKNLIYIIIIIVSSILSLSALCVYTSLTNYIKTDILLNVQHRTLLVNPKKEEEDLGEKELKDIKHIEEVYSAKYFAFSEKTTLETDFLDGAVELNYGSIKLLPNLVAGRKFTESETNVAICPMRFYPDSSAFQYTLEEEHVLNGKELLGTTFSIKYYSFDWKDPNVPATGEFSKDFIIIGVYDNTKVRNRNNQCYIPVKDMIEIIETEIPNEGVFHSFHVIVDDLKNIDDVQNAIREHGFVVRGTTEFDASIINTIKTVCFVMLTIVLIVIISLSRAYIRKKLLNESKMIAILRSLGYNKKNVENIYIFESILVNIFSFIIGLILFEVLLFILTNKLFVGLQYAGIYISLNTTTLLISALVIVFIPFIFIKRDINERCKSDISALIRSDED